MTADSTAQIAVVQTCYLLQVPVYIVGVVGTRLLCAMSGNSVLLRTGLVGVCFNIVGNLAFSSVWGVAGIALSTSCVYVVTTTIVYHELKTRIRKMGPVGVADERLALAA
jgi:putative peptidoglycan lipid II flippase